jgi:hypothetical protein
MQKKPPAFATTLLSCTAVAVLWCLCDISIGASRDYVAKVAALWTLAIGVLVLSQLRRHRKA